MTIDDPCRELHQHLDALEAETERLKVAVRTILRGFDEQVFVRNIEHDHRPDWAVRLLPFVSALRTAKALTDPPGATPVEPEFRKQYEATFISISDAQTKREHAEDDARDADDSERRAADMGRDEWD